MNPRIVREYQELFTRVAVGEHQRWVWWRKHAHTLITRVSCGNDEHGNTTDEWEPRR